MSADAITRLNTALEGRYRVEREVGEGGMATVYLAKDLKHNRNVALKVLKPELAAVVGAERFLAEIETTANLQHPHILPLHDSGEVDGFLYYVMPYIEGESLRQRLERDRQLPVDEAVRIATDVAEALHSAHKQGVIHRDIKPANILLSDGRPLVADFGIALAVTAAGEGRLTETGLSMGTPHYMSPEQATGDQRVGPTTDIYALGCVLYEMLVGEPAYTGSTAQAILGQIIAGEVVTPSKKRKSTPANVEAAIRKALEKLPADRFTSANDFGKALGDPGFGQGDLVASSVGPTRGQWTPTAMALGVAVVILSFGLGWSFLQPETALRVSRLELPLPQDFTVQWVGVAPDGSSVVLAGALQGGPIRLWTRPLDQLDLTPMSGTEGVTGPFAFSPDGGSVAFTALRSVLSMPLDGGLPRTLASTVYPSSPSWGPDGMIYFHDRGSGVFRVPASGGAPELVTAPSAGERARQGPHALPNGRGLLFQVIGEALGQIAVLSFETGEVRALFPGGAPQYAESGHIIYMLRGTLMAVPFDQERLEITGPAQSLVEGVVGFSASADGTLAYHAGAQGQGGLATLALVDRGGREQQLSFDAQQYASPRVSPDGGRLAVAIAESGSTADLWVLDLERGTRSRITYGGLNRYFPTWTPSGDSLTYSDGNLAPNALRTVAVDGTGQPALLLEREGLQYPTSWSSDGTVLAFYEDGGPESGRDLWMLPRGGDPELLLRTPFEERAPYFSPDSRWLAYVSNKSGQDEVYVRPYPGPGPELVVSTTGGVEPVWSPDGSELFYRGPQEMMAVQFADPEGPGIPQPLWVDVYLRELPVLASPYYAVTSDGQGFIMLRDETFGPDVDRSSVVVVQNFFEELKRLVPN